MVKWEETVDVESRVYLSMLHIQSAALFARRSGQIEKDSDSNSSSAYLTECWGHVTASIFHAVAFLEATINEFFADACEEPSENRLDSNTKALMADMWKQGIPQTSRYGISEKFDIALTLARRPIFDAGSPPAQDIQLVVKLRNRLVHYEPEWMSSTTEKKLQ